MKARRVKIDGVEDIKIVLIEPNGDWSVVTTVQAVRDFKKAYAFKDDLGLVRRQGNIIALEEDVEFIGEEFEVSFGL